MVRARKGSLWQGAYFYKGLRNVKGDEIKIHVVCGKIQICFIVGSAMAAKYIPDGEGLAGERRAIKLDYCRNLFRVQ